MSTVPDIVIGRLPVYLRMLDHLSAEGKKLVSSQELGQCLGISAAQIRKDLSYFGGFGKQGAGYNIALLQTELRHILKLGQEHPMVLIGAGDLGRALAHYGGFKRAGLYVALLLDNDPAKIGAQVGELAVEDVRYLEPRVREKGIQIAIIATPAQAAQGIADACARAGVRAILNYAPITLNTPDEVRVQYADPVVHLQRMTYYL